MKFTRRDASGDSLVENLEICLLSKNDFGEREGIYCEYLDRDTPYCVFVTEQSTGHESCHDLDGERLPDWTSAGGLDAGNVDGEIPPDVIEAVFVGWASGTYLVERA